MSFNATNINGLNSGISYLHTQSNVSVHGFRLTAGTANNLGYGIGRTIRGAFDSLWNTWQKMSASEPSALEITQQRNYMIYQGGLRECVKQLGPALANLQMNPNDRGALRKVEQLSTHFASYLKPSREGNLLELQCTILGPLEERVSNISHLPIRNALSKCIPVFFQGYNSICEKTHTGRHSVHTRQSQVMQKSEGGQVGHPSQKEEGFSAQLTSHGETDQNDSHQLVNGFRNVFSSLDSGISRLFSIFPGVSAEPVESDEHKVAVLAKDNQNLAAERIERAFIAYIVGKTNWTDSGEGIVKVFDIDSNKVIANITVGHEPEAIAITPNNHYAYVVNSKSATISVIDTCNNSVITSVALEKLCMPWSIAITPNGVYAYVTCRYNNSVVVIDTVKNNVFTTIDLGEYAKDIAITPNGLYAYVTCPDNESISVIDTLNNSVVNTIDVEASTSGIAINPNGTYAYVTKKSSIGVINTISNKVIATVDLKDDQPESIAINPNGDYVYTLCKRGLEFYFIHVVETLNNTDLDPIRLQITTERPQGRIAVTPDGLYIYAFAGNDYFPINTTSGTADIGSMGFFMNAIAFIPAKVPIPNHTNLIIALSCGGTALITLLGIGSYLNAKRLKKEEDAPELNSLVDPLSTHQQTTFI